MVVPESIWIQFAVTAIVISVVFYLLSEFKKFMKDRDSSWQKYMAEQHKAWQDFMVLFQHNTDKTLASLVVEVKSLTEELVQLRKDFDIAVTTMRERTSK